MSIDVSVVVIEFDMNKRFMEIIQSQFFLHCFSIFLGTDDSSRHSRTLIPGAENLIKLVLTFYI